MNPYIYVHLYNISKYLVRAVKICSSYNYMSFSLCLFNYLIHHQRTQRQVGNRGTENLYN